MDDPTFSAASDVCRRCGNQTERGFFRDHLIFWVFKHFQNNTITGETLPALSLKDRLKSVFWHTPHFLPAHHCRNCGLHTIDTSLKLTRQQAIDSLNEPSVSAIHQDGTPEEI